MRLPVHSCALLVASAMAMAGPTAAEAQTLITPACGAVLPAGDYALGADMNCGTGTGVVLGNPNTTLSLNGRKITAGTGIVTSGSAFGSRTVRGPGTIAATTSGVVGSVGTFVVEDLTVQAGQVGIQMQTTFSGSVLRGNTITAAVRIHVASGPTEVVDNVCAGSSGIGIRLVTDRHDVQDNACQGVPTAITALSGSTGSRIHGNSGVSASDQNADSCAGNSWYDNSFTGGGTPSCVARACDLVGTADRDVLRGTAKAEIICGRGGDDTIYGNGGQDVLVGGSGSDRLLGGWGGDLLDGGAGIDTADFSGGGHTGAMVALEGGIATDTYGDRDGLFEIESLTGSVFDDELQGSQASNTIKGGRGSDRLYGFDGADTLVGGSENDYLAGGHGNEVLVPGAGNDYVDGEQGTDRVSFADAAGGGVSATLGATQPRGGSNVGNDTMTDVEQLVGTSFDDVLTAIAAGIRSKLIGGSGDDSLSSLDGDALDRIVGGAGDDTCARDAKDTEGSC